MTHTDAVDGDVAVASDSDDSEVEDSTLMRSTYTPAPQPDDGHTTCPCHYAVLIALLILTHSLTFFLGSLFPLPTTSLSLPLPLPLPFTGLTSSPINPPSTPLPPSPQDVLPLPLPLPLPPLLNHPPPPSSSPFPPLIRFAYTKSGDWFRSSMRLAALHLFGRYEEAEYSEDTPDLWLVESLLETRPNPPPIPAVVRRDRGQRRLFASAEAYDFNEMKGDFDAIIDTKYHPSMHPHHLPLVYLPWYVNVLPQLGDVAALQKPSTPSVAALWSNFTSRRFAAYLYTHCVPHRDLFFDVLNAHHRVDALGGCRHNTDLPPTSPSSSPGSGTDAWPSAPSVYSHYKFVVCVENAMTPGYMTEKILTAMMGGAIPVYIGAGDVEEHFNPRSFVNVARFDSLDSAARYVAYLHSNDSAYLDMLSQPWFRTAQQGGVRQGEVSPWLVNSTENLFVRQMAQLVNVLTQPGYAFYDHTPVLYWDNIKKWGDKGGG